VKNLTTGGKVNGAKGKTFMAKLSWHPTANIDRRRLAPLEQVHHQLAACWC